MRSAPLLVLLAVLLIQVPWAPCHCSAQCSAVPVLAAVHAPDAGVLADRCPAHGAPGASGCPVPPAPHSDHEGGGGRHEHAVPTVSALQADPSVRLDVAPAVPGTLRVVAAAPGDARSPSPVPASVAGPPARLASVRLLR